jgi:hypothetical protein
MMILKHVALKELKHLAVTVCIVTTRLNSKTY